MSSYFWYVCLLFPKWHVCAKKWIFHETLLKYKSLVTTHMNYMLLELCSIPARRMLRCLKLFSFFVTVLFHEELAYHPLYFNGEEIHIFTNAFWKQNPLGKWWLIRKFTTSPTGFRAFWTRFCSSFTGKHHTYLVIKVSCKIRQCYFNSYWYSATYFKIII